MSISDVPNPWFSWDYVSRNTSDLTLFTAQHARLTLQSLALAVVIGVPLAIWAHQHPRAAGPFLGLSGVLYTIPSLALFAVLAPITGIGQTTVLIGLVAYALMLVMRNTLVGLQGVDPTVDDAARGMGYGPLRLLLRVQLPQALPSVVAGVRLAGVSTVALVTVGVVVGYGGLGQLMFRGFRSSYHAEIMTATLLCLAMALVLDLALMAVGKALTPWSQGVQPA